MVDIRPFAFKSAILCFSFFNAPIVVFLPLKITSVSSSASARLIFLFLLGPRAFANLKVSCSANCFSIFL